MHATVKSAAAIASLAILSLAGCSGKASSEQAPPPAAMVVSPGSLSFVAPLGGADPAPQGVAVSSSGGALALPTTSIAYGSGSGWLTASVSGAAAPYTVTVQPVVGTLAAGTYQATVSVDSAGASNTPRTFTVTFSVVTGSEPTLGLSPTSLAFTADAGGADPAAQTVTVSNVGSGTLASPTTAISYGSGDGWLTVTPSGAAAPYTLTVQPSISALGAGTYTATVSVSSAGAVNSPQTFAVSLTVLAQPTLGLSPSSLSFTATAGGSNPAAQTVTASNVGGGTLAAPTTSIAYGSGAGWLGTAVSGSAAPYTIAVQPDVAGLAVGTYQATVTVQANGASNAPTFGVTLVVAAPGACKAGGEVCGSAGECCSAVCTAGGCATDAFCGAPGTLCASDADCCSMSCPDAGNPGATCAADPCGAIGAGCIDGSTCCSGVCDAGNTCAELPSGSTNSTCTTLGERCAGPLECCSRNCQGADPATATLGWCAPAYTCNAPGDVCWRPEDCCSGLCAAPAAPGQPGRCDDASGGCTQDGVPCDNNSNCCTRLCVDLGSGTRVCQPAAGCRMTGDYCDTTASCCNINQDLNPPGDGNPKAVHCTADHTCDGGGACNPPGNICGASTDVNASQNCCFEGNGSGKPVCKPDSNGILRCFGGPVNATCPSGWDSDDPACCIPPGSGPESICQFRDQCCNMAPCVPDANGVLHCALPDACMPLGGACVPASPDPCCTGATCDPELGCVATAACLASGASCSIPPATPEEACCSGVCTPSTPGGTTGTCATCAPTGSTCSTDAQCCSGACDPESGCLAPCAGETRACTVDADCCVGLACNVPPGATSGTCGQGGTCAATGQTCDLSTPCCDTADTCTGGVCTPPALCSDAAQSCTYGGNECCPGLTCLESNPSPPPAAVPCTQTGTCFCDLDTLACVSEGTTCSYGSFPCCPGSTCTLTEFPLFPCPDPEAPCTCTASP
jgi:hypothetical protein